MDVSEADLTEHFRALSDEALLERLRAGTLTALALEVAEREARSRRLEIPTAEPEADAVSESDESDGPGDDDIDLVTVAQFSNPLKANVLRACLESHGIFAYVWGEHLGVAHIFMSIAGGGVRVQVRSDQVAEAREVIAAFERGDFAIDEEPE
jgi:Putative prokaryotic signal transducing protein